MIKKRRILCLLALLLCALCAAAFADTLYYTSDGVQGTVGIVGPKRMDYEKVVGALKTLKTQLEEIYKSHDT